MERERDMEREMETGVETPLEHLEAAAIPVWEERGDKRPIEGHRSRL
jgi:hypothetical protein